MGFFQRIDRHLWSVPVIVFLATELAFGWWSAASSKPVLLAAAPVTTRQMVYSSLTGSSSALLGLALAAVAILAAFGPRPDRTGQTSPFERSLTRARTNIAGALLAASFFMLVVVIVSTIGMAIDAKQSGNVMVTALVEAAGCASVAGLLIGGAGLALVLVERSQR